MISLNGTWRFKLEQSSKPDMPPTSIPAIQMPEHPEPFQTMDYKEDSSWHDIKVPGTWEMQGYSPATYWQPDNCIGLYRLEFDVPADWRDRRVLIDFDGVQNGAEVYLNGQPVEVHEPSWGRKNYHEGGWNPFQVDLTPAVKFGEKNLLAVRVMKNTKSADMDSGDFFFLGGIYRNVRLFSVPRTAIEDLTIRTNLLDDGKAEVHVILGGKSHGTVTLQGEPAVQIKGNEVVIPVDHPKLWSAEKPNLYDLAVDLKNESGKTIEHIDKRIGIRQVTIKDGVLLVNNMPVKLAGMCRHEDWATLGPSLTDAEWRKDIEMMKANNVNAIRTSHYPYGSGFYDLCDELGMYVADEMAACWVRTNTDDLTPAFAQHAREYVQRDKNHPCIIIWAVGNENPSGKNNKVSADAIRKLDPTRPRLVSTKTADESNVEFDDQHYPSLQEMAKDEASPRRKKFPMIYLENPNTWDVRNGTDFGSDDIWGAVLQREWQEIFKDPHVPGTFLWEWQDRAVVDQCTTKLYDYYPETGINVVKIKGLVDAFRDPRPMLYSVKMACSPVQVDPKIKIEGGNVIFHARNFYSFTDLSELKTRWHILDQGKDVASGGTDISLAPMSEGELVESPGRDALGAGDVLRLNFAAPDGCDVVTYDFRLKPEPDTTPARAQGVEGINFPHLNFTTVDVVGNKIAWISAHRHPGKLIDIKLTTVKETSDMNDAALYATPLAEVRSVDADVQMDVPPMGPAGKDKKPTRPGEAEMAKAAPQNVAHVHVDFKDGKFSYEVHWKGKRPADVQELGWKFVMPKSCDHFSWHHQTLWSYYPDNQIGRPQGTATPDSADQQLTKLTRIDAFDFVSSKYHCDWASLGDQQGQGIVITCDAKDRQQCRGGIETDGYDLVVNKQASPPEDLSSNIVPDFYLNIPTGKSVSSEFMVAAMAK